MSVSISQQPQAYMPGYSPLWFTALSDQIAQDNFLYTVICTDLISSDEQTYQIPQRPDGYCVFDAGPFAESRLTHYLPINEYGWKKATGVRKIRVNIGETYGSTPVYASGANTDFIIWNAIEDHKDFPSFTYNDYIYTISSNEVVLNSTLRDKTFSQRSNLLYVHTSGPGDFVQLTIETFSHSGAALWTSFIANPYEASTDYREKYLCIDIGHKGLSNISSLLVTGAYPIITSNVGSYKVYSDGQLIKIIDVECEPMYDVYTIHYLKKNGAFQTLNFSKRSDTEIVTEKTYYKKLPYELSGGEYEYSRTTSVERVLETLSREKLKLNTDWLSEDHVEDHRDLADSPLVYLDLGHITSYIPLKVMNGSYKLNRSYNEKVFSIEMDFEHAYQNTRQRV